MIRFYKLFDLMNRRGLMRTDLLHIMSSRTLAKLNRGDPIRTDTIDKICDFLNVQPGDIMEYCPQNTKEDIEKGIEDLCERFDLFYDQIPKEEMKLIIKKHIKKTKDGEAILEHDKLIKEIKDIHFMRDLEDRMERKGRYKENKKENEEFKENK